MRVVARALIVVMVAGAFSQVATRARAAEPCTFRVVPPEEKVLGRTLGEWGDEWWIWGAQAPTTESPIQDPDGRFGHVGQSLAEVLANPCRKGQGPVHFLAGTGGATAERTLTVCEGEYLFFPIMNVVVWTPTDCQDCQECLVAARRWIEMQAKVLSCDVDGVQIPDLTQYLVGSEECFCLTVPADNILSLPEGRSDTNAQAGFYLMLEPLCTGSHTVHFIGRSDSWGLEVTYHLTVEPCQFRRGDANDDGKINIADAITALAYLFSKGALSCPDAADGNDDGTLNVADAIAILGNLFGHAGPLPAPFDACGTDTTQDMFPIEKLTSCANP